MLPPNTWPILTNYVLNLLFILNLYGQKFSTLVRCLQIFYNKKSNHICQLICRSTKQISTSSCTKIFTFASKCLVKEIFIWIFEWCYSRGPMYTCLVIRIKGLFGLCHLPPSFIMSTYSLGSECLSQFCSTQ